MDKILLSFEFKSTVIIFVHRHDDDNEFCLFKCSFAFILTYQERENSHAVCDEIENMGQKQIDAENVNSECRKNALN